MQYFTLTKVGRQWAIFDTVSRVFYYGSKKDLEKRVKELNKTIKLTDKQLKEIKK